jgi:hypothetical protein
VPRVVDVTVPRVVDVTVHRVVDDTAPRRRWPKVVAGAAMLAAASVAAAVVLRRRKNEGTYGTPGEAADAGTGPQAAQDGQLQAGPDGSGAEENVNRQSSAT